MNDIRSIIMVYHGFWFVCFLFCFEGHSHVHHFLSCCHGPVQPSLPLHACLAFVSSALSSCSCLQLFPCCLFTHRSLCFPPFACACLLQLCLVLVIRSLCVYACLGALFLVCLSSFQVEFCWFWSCLLPACLFYFFLTCSACILRLIQSLTSSCLNIFGSNPVTYFPQTWHL